MNDVVDDLLMKNSNFYGKYYCKKVKDFFDEGDLVTIYSHYSYRLFTVGKNNKIFKAHYTDFGSIFFTQEQWRNKKINSILRK